MANRAYLYSSDRPDAWERPEEDYYDSRWTIPLAWFFFYRPDDIRMADVHYNGSHWQEIKFAAKKRDALALIAAREPLLLSLVGGRISRDAVAGFVATIAKRPGRFLLMDPEEVLGAEPEDAPVHAERFIRILTLLRSGEGPQVVREATRPYVGLLDPNPYKCLCQVIGYTYS